MVFYNFYLDKWKSSDSLRYRTEDGWTELQVNLKMFSTKQEAELDFMALLFENEDFRQGEYFDTEKGKKKKTTTEKGESGIPSEAYKIPEGFHIELDKVYNKDCLTLMAELPNKFLDYIFTSPPYNISKQIGSEGQMYAEYADDLTSEEYFKWLCDIIDEGMRVTKFHFFMNIQMLGKNKECVLELFGKYRKIIKDRMIWQKSIVAPHIQPGIMNSAFEDIIVFSNDRPSMKVFSDAKWSQGTFNNVIKGLNASQNKYKILNKATFPVYLPRIFMQNFGGKGKLWFDPFSGTGTTFLAAEIEEMRFLGTELDPKQCEATNKRIWVEESALKFEFGDGQDANLAQVMKDEDGPTLDDAINACVAQIEKVTKSPEQTKLFE